MLFCNDINFDEIHLLVEQICIAEKYKTFSENERLKCFINEYIQHVEFHCNTVDECNKFLEECESFERAVLPDFRCAMNPSTK